jgi:hypothetical protein
MTRPRPAGLHQGYTRFILWVDTSALSPELVDELVNAVLAATEGYAPAAHVEIPLGLQ